MCSLIDISFRLLDFIPHAQSRTVAPLTVYFQSPLRPTSRWLNSSVALGIAGIELDPGGPPSALSD